MKTMLLLLMCSTAFSQQAVESAEHRSVRLQYEKTKDEFEKQNKSVKDQEAELNALEEAYNKESCRQNALQRVCGNIQGRRDAGVFILGLLLPKLQKLTDEATRQDERLEFVDDCVKVYAATIDKKTSDLTTRETDQISVCKMLDLYPVKP